MNRRAFLRATGLSAAVGVSGYILGRGSGRNTVSTATADSHGCRVTEESAGENPTPRPNWTESVTTDTTERTVSPTQTTSGAITDTARMTPVTPDVRQGEKIASSVDELNAGELLVVPPGRYTWESKVRFDADDWGIRCHPDTIFEVPPGVGDGEAFELLQTHSSAGVADNVLLENLTFDSRGRSAPALYFDVRNRGHVNGLEYAMDGPLSNQHQDNGLHVHARNRTGVVRVDSFRQFNNGDLGAYADGDSRIGVWVGPKNQGTVHLRNPVLQGFPNNACYVSRQPGSVVVENGILLNNNVSAVRVGGGVEVHGTTIGIDIDTYRDGPGRIEAGGHDTRGVWGDNRGAGSDGGLVADSTFLLKSYESSQGLATILENTHMTVRESGFLLQTDIEAVKADTGEIELVKCDFGGTAADPTAGIGNITGWGNYVASNVDPGDIPLSTDGS
jgi:hypothetical protein